MPHTDTLLNDLLQYFTEKREFEKKFIHPTTESDYWIERINKEILMKNLKNILSSSEVAELKDQQGLGAIVFDNIEDAELMHKSLIKYCFILDQAKRTLELSKVLNLSNIETKAMVGDYILSFLYADGQQWGENEIQN